MGSNTSGYALMWRTGLGNMMLPWARSYIWCKDNNATMIAPIWRRLRLGQYLRKEADKRQYHRLFTNDGYLRGPARAWRLNTWKRVKEETVQSQPTLDRTVVVFHGVQPYFAPIRSRSLEVRAELLRICKPHTLKQVPVSPLSIGLHVRRGDFSASGDGTILRKGGENYRIPIEWYVEALRLLRANLGNLGAVVASDGTPDELKPLLLEPDVDLLPRAEPIADMLALSTCAALVASGSTFSMWASYLGQVPTLWFPGQRRQLVLADESDQLEPEWESSVALPQRFLDRASDRLGALKTGMKHHA